MSVKTGFVKVAQSGETIDGREIKAQWLIDAAESYDKDVYIANIYPEHWEWADIYGYVEALEYSENKDGVVSLFANLCPNIIWLNAARDGQRLFTSIALKDDFPSGGNHYLYSMAATNNPASAGVEQLQFSKKHPNILYLESVEMSANLKKKSKKSFSFFKKNKEPDMPKPNPELEEIKTQLAGIEQKFSTLGGDTDEKQFATLKAEHEKLQTKFSTIDDENKLLKKKVADSETEFSSFKDQFNTLKTAFEKAVKDPHDQTDTNGFNAGGSGDTNNVELADAL